MPWIILFSVLFGLSVIQKMIGSPSLVAWGKSAHIPSFLISPWLANSDLIFILGLMMVFQLVVTRMVKGSLK